MISGPKIVSCNCDYGCPCEFNARPTNAICEGLEAHRIDEGWFGETRLDGLVIGSRYRWPGPVHEGKGLVQGFISEQATEEQRAALFQILDGKEQEPNTMFNIYGSTFEKEFDPIFADIEFECDLEAHTGRFHVPGSMEMTLEPIRNPITGKRHRAQINLPGGFEFRTAEMASGSFQASGDIALDSAGVYAYLAEVAYGPYGIIEEKTLGGHAG
jgi:hypothetical protein